MHNDTTAHEESDINIRAVVSATVVVAVVCATTAVLMLGLFRFLEGQAKGRDPKLSPLAIPATDMPKTTSANPAFGSAPDPKLLTNEPQYLGTVRTDWQKELHAYGWVDQSAGVVRIPIDRAKELLVHRGSLAVRAEPIEDPKVGTHAPADGESSSGRTLTKPAVAAAETPAAVPAQQKPAEHKPAAEGHK